GLRHLPRQPAPAREVQAGRVAARRRRPQPRPETVRRDHLGPRHPVRRRPRPLPRPLLTRPNAGAPVTLDHPTEWAAAHWPLLTAAGVLTLLAIGVCTLIARRTSGAVLTAGLGALVCTGFSADTSWRFAGR